MPTTSHHTPTARQTATSPSLIAGARLALNVARERRSRAKRPRVPEPMVMDNPTSVAAFHTADPLLQLPIYRFNALAMSALLPDGGTVLDLGTGSGRLLAHLAQARPDVRAVGIDLADNMLTAGRASLREDRLADRVELRKGDITKLPTELPTEIDLVCTVWALHHLPTKEHLERCLAEIARIRQNTGCAVWVFDFARLHRQATFDAIIAMHPNAPRRLREDGIASERAAWTATDLRHALDHAGLHDLSGGPEPRIGSLQAYHAPRRDRRPSAHDARWSAPPLPRPSQLMFRRVCTHIPSPNRKSDSDTKVGIRTEPSTAWIGRRRRDELEQTRARRNSSTCNQG